MDDEGGTAAEEVLHNVPVEREGGRREWRIGREGRGVEEKQVIYRGRRMFHECLLVSLMGSQIQWRTT